MKHPPARPTSQECFRARDELTRKLIALESEAARLKMWRTMHAINAAKNVLGWEIAGELEHLLPALQQSVTDPYR